METLRIILDLSTVLWLLGWSIASGRLILSGERHTILFVIPVHTVFTGFPILADYMIGTRDLSQWPGFLLASQDQVTSIIYDLYIAAVPLILWKFGRGSHLAPGNQLDLENGKLMIVIRRYWIILWIPITAPFMLAVFSPRPDLYTNYALSQTDFWAIASDDVRSHHTRILAVVRFSLIAMSVYLLAVPKLGVRHFLIVMPWALAALWLHGKRSVVAFAIVLLFYVIWQRKVFVGGRLLLFAGVLTLLMAGFSTFYQSDVKNVDSRSTYQSVRLDYGRDAQIKMAIYAERHPEDIQILKHRGQSLLFYVTIAVPRDLWPEKPLPYAQYVTSAMFMEEPRLWGWGVTTSLLDEAVSNLGYIGMLAGPLFLALFCKVGDSRNSIEVQIVTILCAVLFMTLHPVGFFPLLVLWALLVLLVRPKASGSEAIEAHSHWATSQ